MPLFVHCFFLFYLVYVFPFSTILITYQKMRDKRGIPILLVDEEGWVDIDIHGENNLI